MGSVPGQCVSLEINVYNLRTLLKLDYIHTAYLHIAVHLTPRCVSTHPGRRMYVYNKHK